MVSVFIVRILIYRTLGPVPTRREGRHSQNFEPVAVEVQAAEVHQIGHQRHPAQIAFPVSQKPQFFYFEKVKSLIE